MYLGGVLPLTLGLHALTHVGVPATHDTFTGTVCHGYITELTGGATA